MRDALRRRSYHTEIMGHSLKARSAAAGESVFSRIPSNLQTTGIVYHTFGGSRQVHHPSV